MAKGQRLARPQQEMGRGPFSTEHNIQEGKVIVLLFLFQLMTSRRQAERAHKHTHTHSQTHKHTHRKNSLLIKPTGQAVPSICMLRLDSSWTAYRSGCFQADQQPREEQDTEIRLCQSPRHKERLTTSRRSLLRTCKFMSFAAESKHVCLNCYLTTKHNHILNSASEGIVCK